VLADPGAVRPGVSWSCSPCPRCWRSSTRRWAIRRSCICRTGLSCHRGREPRGRGFQHTFHRDFPRDLHGYVASLNVMLVFDHFTELNGGTLVVPGTHQRAPSSRRLSTSSRRRSPSNARAGSMILFDSTLWHAAGAQPIRPRPPGGQTISSRGRSSSSRSTMFARSGDEAVLSQPPAYAANCSAGTRAS